MRRKASQACGVSSTSTLAISDTPSVAPAPAALTVKNSGADHLVRAPACSSSCAGQTGARSQPHSSPQSQTRQAQNIVTDHNQPARSRTAALRTQARTFFMIMPLPCVQLTIAPALKAKMKARPAFAQLLRSSLLRTRIRQRGGPRQAAH